MGEYMANMAMPAATLLRARIEAVLADRIPSALTPAPRMIRPVAATGIRKVDELLEGGLPLGAITEMVGPESSGRTSLALSFIARMTQAVKICAWVDVSNTLHPESVAASGVDLSRLLWVRCGVPISRSAPKYIASGKPWSRIDQALRVTDLLLQAGGFGSIVLDMGCIAPEFASRVPLATWFRYRAAAERSQASVLLLTQHACARSSAALVLRFESGRPLQAETTVFTGIEHRVEIARERFTPSPANVIPLRKPPQNERSATWRTRTAWAGRR
jgi:recombination protein RecA